MKLSELDTQLADLRMKYIKGIVEDHKWNVTAAAVVLGVRRDALHHILVRADIRRPVKQRNSKSKYTKTRGVSVDDAYLTQRKAETRKQIKSLDEFVCDVRLTRAEVNMLGKLPDIAHMIVDDAAVTAGTWNLEAEVASFERDLLLKCLKQTCGNRKLAAKQLKISYRSMRYKLEQFGIV